MCKICKKIISFWLVFVLSIPAFCANLDGDATAFVTKEEFDLALSDFNKRLTVFEAGINSKIDAQVSSYLDRNGIWSAKEVSLDAGKKALAFFNNISAGGTATTATVWTGPRSDSGADKWNKSVYEEHSYYDYKDKIDDIRRVGIASMPKSGLCVMPLIIRTSYWSSLDTEANAIAKVKAGNAPSNGTSAAHPYWLMKFYQNGGEDGLTTNIDQLVQGSGATWQGSYYYLTNTSPWISNCFSQSLNIYNGTALRYNIIVNQLLQTPSQSGWENHGSRFYCASFGDPIVKEVCMFFVDKGKSLEFESHINHTGWSVANFKSMHQTQMMNMVVQPEKIEVY